MKISVKPASPSSASVAINNNPPSDMDTRLEALLMTADHPLSIAKLADLLEGVTKKDINAALERLNAVYEESARSFRAVQVAGGWQIMTLPEFADLLDAAHKSRSTSRLSPAAMETLAIIAYKQPILRADIEAIRGVASGEVTRGLMDRGLVKIVGRAEELGRPMLYGTTTKFLEVFGLASARDLPKVEELLHNV